LYVFLFLSFCYIFGFRSSSFLAALIQELLASLVLLTWHSVKPSHVDLPLFASHLILCENILYGTPVHGVHIDEAENTIFEPTRTDGNSPRGQARIVIDQPSLELLSGNMLEYDRAMEQLCLWGDLI
jgi:hypothetical protein